MHPQQLNGKHNSVWACRSRVCRCCSDASPRRARSSRSQELVVVSVGAVLAAGPHPCLGGECGSGNALSAQLAAWLGLGHGLGYPNPMGETSGERETSVPGCAPSAAVWVPTKCFHPRAELNEFPGCAEPVSVPG